MCWLDEQQREMNDELFSTNNNIGLLCYYHFMYATQVGTLNEVSIFCTTLEQSSIVADADKVWGRWHECGTDLIGTSENEMLSTHRSR